MTIFAGKRLHEYQPATGTEDDDTWRRAVEMHERALAGAQLPELPAQGIRWRNDGDSVVISVDVMNSSSRSTHPTTLVVEAAELGAFAPWQPLSRLAVPLLEPGERRRLALTVPFAELPRLRTDRALLSPAAFGGLADLDDFDPLWSADWAGNLNIWFDRARADAVEVHRALDLQITHGRNAKVVLFMPPGELEYEVSVSSDNAGFGARVVRLAHTALAFLVVRAPKPGERAAIHVIVKRSSDGRTVPVEFAFQSVGGPARGLGCMNLSFGSGF